jgi:hypothetical protein
MRRRRRKRRRRKRRRRNKKKTFFSHHTYVAINVEIVVVVRIPVGSRIFNSPCRNQLWVPPSLLCNGYWGGGEAAGT